MTALPTARGLEWDDLLGPSNTCHAKVLLFLSTSSNTESCLLRYSLITSSFTKGIRALHQHFPPVSGSWDSKMHSIRDFFHVLSHQVPCPILLWAQILPSLPFVVYILLQALLVCDMPGHIQLQLNSNFPKLTSVGTPDKVSALLTGDLFLFPLPVCFLSVFVIDLVYPSNSCSTFSQFYLASSSLEWTYSAWKQCSSDSYYIF